MLEQLALCAELIDGAYDVLHILQGTRRFAIVTNGLQAVQRSRLAHSPIRDYITELIISEEVGAAKPKAAFFAAAFARLGYLAIGPSARIALASTDRSERQSRRPQSGPGAVHAALSTM